MDALAKGPLPRYPKVEGRNTKVKLFPDAAILTGNVIYTGLPKPGATGPVTPTTYRITTGWADEKGTWRLVTWQVTAVAPPRPAAR